MNLAEMKVPCLWIVAVAIFAITSTVAVEIRYAHAGDIKAVTKSLQQYIISQEIRDNRQWIELKEEKLERTTEPEKREKILRQINRLETTIETNLEKLQ